MAVSLYRRNRDPSCGRVGTQSQPSVSLLGERHQPVLEGVE